MFNIFNPSGPGVARGTPISYSEWGSDLSIRAYRQNVDMYPKHKYLVPDFPLQNTSCYYDETYNETPDSFLPAFPGGLHLDQTLAGTIDRYQKLKIDPSEINNSHFYCTPIGAAIWGKSPSQVNGFWEAPFLHYNNFHSKLPEYVVLDASDPGLATLAGTDPHIIGLSKANNVKLLLRRDDRIGTMAYDVSKSTAYGDSSVGWYDLATTPFLFTMNNNYWGELVPKLPIAASYIPIYDITNKRIPQWHDPAYSGDINDVAQLCLCCRPFCDYVTYSSGSIDFTNTIAFTPMEWHILYYSPIKNQFRPFEDPLIFSPKSAFFWESMSEDRKTYYKWYDTKLSNIAGSTSGPTDGFGDRSLYLYDVLSNPGESPSVYSRDLYNFHGWLSLTEPTDFILSCVGIPYGSNPPGGLSKSYASASAINAAPKITVTPAYL